MAQQNKEVKEKKCRIVFSNKKRMIKSTHNWVVSFDPKYSICQDCGMAKRN